MKSLLRRVSLLVLLGSSVALWPGGDAAAQSTQKKTQAPVLPDAAKPGESLQQDQGKKKEERRPVSVQEFLQQGGNAQYEALAAQKRDEAIEKLKQILASGNIVGDQKAEMLLRLAELYYDKAQYLYSKETQAWDKAYAAWFDDQRPEAEKGPEPAPNNSESKALKAQAVELYREILRDYPKYARTDEVLFYLAFNLMDLGDDRESLEKYQTLVKSFPNSSFVPNAYLAIGEYYFDRNQAFKALNNYKKAASYEGTNVYSFATYKLGWAYYNVGEYNDAIASMKEVIAKSGTEDTGRLNLKEDALKDLVLFFAEAGQMDEAYSYFSRYAGKDYYKACLKQIAAIQLEQSKFDDAISTYRKLIAEEPMAVDAPSIQGKIIQAYFKQGKKQETLQQIEVLVATYGPQSEWAKVNAAKPDALKEANDLIQGQLIAVAVDYHKEARKTKSRKTYEAAYDSYGRYLELFPNAEDAYEVRFAFAEIKYDLHKFDEAADEYQRVVEMDPKGKHLELAASSWILSINEVLKKDENKPNLPPNKTETTALNAWEERKVSACQRFVELLPANEDSPTILYEAGRILYNHNFYAKADVLFFKLIESYPEHKTTEIAANLVLDGYNQLEDWDNLDRTARQFYANPNIAKGAFKAELKDLYEKATFKKIQAIEVAAKEKTVAAGGDGSILPKAEAATVSGAYMKFYEEFPDSTVADVALNNSAVYAFQAGEVQRSIELREALLAKFPESALKQKNLEALGRNYESVADYDRASSYFERLVASDKEKTYPGTADALYNAALYRESLGQWEQAITHYRAYSAQYPDREDSQAVLLDVARILEEHDKLTEAADLYKKLMTSTDSRFNDDRLFEIRAKYGRVLRAQNQIAAARKHYQESVDLYAQRQSEGAKMEIASLYVAEMKFYLVEAVAEKFRAIKLELPEKVLLKRFEEKGIALNEAIQAYVSVIALGEGEWGMAALHEIGMLYKSFAEAILQSPIPPQLKGQQIAIYEARLQDRAYPSLDKAAEAMEQCLAKAYELGIYNHYSASAAALLAELRPKEYPPLAERLGSADHLSQPLYSADFMSR